MNMRGFLLVVFVLLGLPFSTGSGGAQTSASGAVVAWGPIAPWQSPVLAGLSGVTVITDGGSHSLARTGTPRVKSSHLFKGRSSCCSLRAC